MPFIYIRNSDQVVLSVRDSAVETIPSGVTQYEESWSGDISHAIWSLYKVIRNEDGTYTDSQVLHPDDNSEVF